RTHRPTNRGIAIYARDSRRSGASRTRRRTRLRAPGSAARTWARAHVRAARGGQPPAVAHEPPRTRIGRSNMDPRDRLLWEMVAVCCISETMNTSLMTRCLEVVKDEDIRAT